MPRRPTEETWRTTAMPLTPLQRGAFLDECTRWLVEEPRGDAATAALLQPRTDWTGDVGSLPERTPVAFTAAEHTATSRRRCLLCGGLDGPMSGVVANPFAQRPIVNVCSQCVGSA